MQHVFTLDSSAFANGGTSDWLSGRHGCAIRVAQLDRASVMPPLRRCAVDRTLFVLSGPLSVQLGTEDFEAPKHALVLIPAGTAHAEASLSSGEARYLEVFAPSPPTTVFEPATVHPVENAGGLIRPTLSENFVKGGFAYQALAERKTGSEHLRVNLVEVQPGSGSPDFHIHGFDQYYFILSGLMTMEIGRKTYEAPANSLVYLPAGLVHRNYNLGPGMEAHVTLIVPEPREGEIFDYACEIHDYEAEIMKSAPAYQRT